MESGSDVWRAARRLAMQILVRNGAFGTRSACQTAFHEVHIGDGGFGLRRTSVLARAEML
jgi:hypothetical protein